MQYMGRNGEMNRRLLLTTTAAAVVGALSMSGNALAVGEKTSSMMIFPEARWKCKWQWPHCRR
jgi:hypothetical protein